MLKEFAESTPTFFFQQIQSYFDCVFNAVWDSKVYTDFYTVCSMLFGIARFLLISILCIYCCVG